MFDDLITHRTPPPNRLGQCDGDQEQHLSEGAVMVAFAIHLLRTVPGVRMVSIHPDGEHGKRFDFRAWLRRRGFTMMAPLGTTSYGGTYVASGGKTIVVNPSSGRGDVVAEGEGIRTTDNNGNGEGIEREVAVDVPKYRYAGRDEFENPWHLASWLPNDPDGPTVLMNEDSPLLEEAIRHHLNQYPDVYAKEVTDIVRKTYGEIAVCKLAHSQKLAAQVAEEDLDQYYRSEQALTIALMGLLAEESLIAQRLGKLGRKKNAA